MRLKILSPQGMKASELRAIDTLKEGLRPAWYAYASFLAKDRQGSMEIDLLIFTHSRILLVEVKEWRGKVYSDGMKWKQVVGSREIVHSAPVQVKREHSMRLDSLFKKELQHRWGCYYPVETCVVMAGDATIEQMPGWEKEFVFTLDEFLKIRSEKGFEELLPARNHERLLANNVIKRPNAQEQIDIFEDWVTGGGSVSTRYREAGGYILTESKASFQHPKKIYAEFTGEHREDAKDKALMRCWDFNQLGKHAMTQEQRASVGLREERVVRYVGQQNRQLRKDYLLNPKHNVAPGEVDEDLVEVYEHPPLLERLDTYMSALPHTIEARSTLLRAVLAPFSALHEIGVAHRDIAPERLWWDRQSQAVIVSGLVASQFPDQQGKSVGDVRQLLASSAIPVPEELLGEEEIDAARIDVYQLGVLAYKMAFNQALPLQQETVEWVEPEKDPFEGKLTKWIRQAIEMLPDERQANAGQLLEELTQILYVDAQQEDDNNSVYGALNKNLSQANMMVDWGPATSIEQDFSKQRMSYQSVHGGKQVTVRIWSGLQPQEEQAGRNRHLLRFIERCHTLRSNTLQVPQLYDFGFSMMGLFTVQEYIEDGQTLAVWLDQQDFSLPPRLQIAESILRAVNQLHDLGLAHGDLKPENVLVRLQGEKNKITLLDMLDLDSNGRPPFNHEYSPPSDVSGKARDRYAVYLIIDELFSRCGGQAKNIRQEIELALGDDLQQVPKSLEPLRYTLENASLPVKAETPTISFSWGDLMCSETGEDLESDQGNYYLSVRKTPSDFRFYITGARKKLALFTDYVEKRLVLSKARLYEISASVWLQESQDATNPKQLKSQVISQPIHLKKGPRHGEEELLKFLQKQSAVQAVLKTGQAMGNEQESIIHEQSESAGDAQVQLTKLWQELVDAERDLHPTVTVIGKPERNGRQWYIPIQEDVRNFELSEEEKVQVTNDDPEERWYYGNLDLTNIEDGVLVVTEGRYIEGLRPNTKLQLVEARSESSWQRRQKALYRVLQGEALIPELTKYFDLTATPVEDELPPLKAPAEQEMQRFNLDASKQQAMRHVLNKRLNVIMGPPGTGKTTLLANLLEHLHHLPEVNKILLVSQSHVAVNEVAIRTREVISRLARSDGLDPEMVEPSMVRLGDRSRLGPELLDIHVEALQSQYRTAFHRDFDARLLALSPRLGLPKDLILDAASLYRRFGRELHEYDLARKTCADLKAAREGAVSKPNSGKEREYEVAQQQFLRLHDALSGKLREYTDEFESLLESEDPQSALLEVLAQRHQVNNPLQVSRLSEVVSIAHHWYQRLSADEDGFAGFAAKTRRLVIGTLVGIGKSSYNLAKNEYDIAIIDEAGRATASELAMAMQSAKRVILVGDHKQLPPLYDKSLITQVSSKLGLDEKEVRRTDFERAFLKSQGYMLDTQYRMAQPIGDLVSHVFYEGGLHTGRPPAPDWMKQLSSPWDRTVTWLDTSHSPQMEQHLGKLGVANLAEIDLVCSLLQQLTEDSEAMEQLRTWAHDDKLPPIGIITGYRKQVDALRQRLDSDSWATAIRSLVRVDTIDSYQGSENRVVLLSLVRHNADKKIGFLDDFPRINVALSRAKERLIVIGAGSMWQQYKAKSPLSLVYNYISVKSELSDSEYQVLTPEELLQAKGEKEMVYAP